MRIPILLAAMAPVLISAESQSRIEIRLEGLRNAKGVVQLCLTAKSATFPDCARDPQAITRTVPARSASAISLDAVRPGTYALAIFHDENGNQKLDTFLGVPREGFGFSRNPPVHFGPPRFERARFEVSGGIARVTIRMQYLL